MLQSWNIAPMLENNNLSFTAQKRNDTETFCLWVPDEHNCWILTS